MHTHRQKHIYVHTKTTSQTALHPLLLTPTPSESSHHPPLHSLIHSPPNCPPFPLFSPCTWFKSCNSGFTRSKHKASSYASRRSPTGEASIPSWIERACTDRVRPLFFLLPFPYRIKPLGFWMVCTIYPHPQLDCILKVRVKWSVRQSAHKWALFNVCSRTLLSLEDAEWMDLIGACTATRVLQFAAQ